MSLHSLAEYAIEKTVDEFMSTSWKEYMANLCMNGQGTIEIDMSPYEKIVYQQETYHNILTGDVFENNTYSKGITFWSKLFEAIRYEWLDIKCSRFENYLILTVF